jgi:hypothetical protein
VFLGKAHEPVVLSANRGKSLRPDNSHPPHLGKIHARLELLPLPLTGLSTPPPRNSLALYGDNIHDVLPIQTKLQPHESRQKIIDRITFRRGVIAQINTIIGCCDLNQNISHRRVIYIYHLVRELRDTSLRWNERVGGRGYLDEQNPTGFTTRMANGIGYRF